MKIYQSDVLLQAILLQNVQTCTSEGVSEHAKKISKMKPKFEY